MKSIKINSPIGGLKIDIDNLKIIKIIFLQHEIKENIPKNLQFIADEFEKYFFGEIQKIDLPILLKGTRFQELVWQELIKIPYAQTVSYKELANRIFKPKAARAIGMANHLNPIPLIIPCHRVIYQDGGLGGYSAGVHIKKWLLQHESGFLK